MGGYHVTWFIILLPLIGALASFLAETHRRAAQICVGFTAVAFLLALVDVVLRFTHASQAPFTGSLTYFAMSPTEGNVFATRFEPFFGIQVDSLSVIFAAANGFVVVLVQLYALTWFRGQPSYRRFFWASSLFAFAVQGFVFSPNLFQSLVMWLLGSATLYLTALHWTDRIDAAAPARRALVVLRISDVALLLAALYTFVKFGIYTGGLPTPAGLDISDPFGFNNIGHSAAAVLHHQVSGSGPKTLAVIASLVIFAAIVRGAQLAFQVWLTELAAAPAPVLALAGTAGGFFAAFLVARMYGLLVLVPHALTALAISGAVAALFAAIVALAQRDIMRIAALVAVVQFGLGLAALGAGGYSQGLFVLFTSTVLTALCLLAIGNLTRVYRTRDIREMGGGWRRLRLTSIALGVWALGVGGLSLNTYAALSSAFASASGAAHLAAGSRLVVSVLIAVTALVVALAAMRTLVIVCSGEVARRRGFQAERVRDVERPLRRWTSVGAMASCLSVIAGLPVLAPVFGHLVRTGNQHPSTPLDGVALLAGLGALLAGAAAAWRLFAVRWRTSTERRLQRAAPLTGLTARAFHLDRAAHRAGRPFVRAGELVSLVDARVLDGLTDSLADVPLLATSGAARLRALRPSLQLAGIVLAAAVVTLLSVLAATGHLGGRTL